MMLIKRTSTFTPYFLFSLFFLFTIQTESAKGADFTDKANTKDHPLISRYPGFVIKEQAQFEYDQAKLVIGKFDSNKNSAPTLKLEGKITNTVYRHESLTPDVTALQMYKNYQEALNKLDATILFSCRNGECEANGDASSAWYIGFWMRSQTNVFKGMGGDIPVNGEDMGLLLAKTSHEGKAIHIMIAISAVYRGNPSRLIAMSIVESAELETDKIAINSPDEIAAALNKYDKIVLDGIYFDHDKATIKDSSTITMNAIAAFLKKNTDKHFYVVGHTDNTGDYHYNLNLSRDRAEAVVNMLTKKYKINKQRLNAVGIGPVSPAQSNQSDKGKSANRRVELVNAQ